MSLRTLIILALLVAALSVAKSVEAASAPTQVQASEILSKMAEGQPVYYEGVSIVGDMNLSALPESRAKSSLEIINCTVSNAGFDGVSFERDVVFWGTSFGNASFTGASFHQPANFDGAMFQDGVSFMDAHFDKDASFNRVHFSGDADFNYSRFGTYAYFSGVQFLGNATFSDVEFQGVLDFGSASLTRNANFIRSQFEDAASFSDTLFGGQAQFGLTRFSGLSSFGNTSFDGEANFALARFGDAAYFSGAHFLNIALFGLARFEDIASFQEAAFEDDMNFKGAQITTLLLEKARYGKDCRIILNDTEFNRLKAHWNEINDHVVYDPGAYLALVDNYRGLGWSRDEDDCYYQYRSMNQAQKSLGWSKAIDVLAWLSCGYGVRPSYAVAWSLLTILAFGLVFWRGDGIRRSARPLQGPAEKDSVPEKATFRNALFFSTMIFLSQGPIDFLPVGRNRYYVILEGILGWLLLALFLVTLGKVMIR